jgi:serine/threonine protein kinase/tetratricopeptide (TPR) repeat protein/WD40 repeat protein
MNGAQAKRNPVEELAEEFLERYRRGERPALSEYTGRYPDLAAEIRDLFPALVMMEEAGPKSAEARPARAISGARPLCDRLGDYRILREVGRGGMGVVYEADQESLSRHVALKVLPAQFAASPIHLQRFRREARSAARLHHTNIVPVFDVGEFQGTHYYAMQFIQGQGLDEILDELRRLRGVASPNGNAAPEKNAALADSNLTVALARGLLTNRFAAGESVASEANAMHGAQRQEIEQVSAPTAHLAGGMPEHAEDRSENDAVESGTGKTSTASVLGTRTELSTQSEYHYYRSAARVGLQVAEALAYAHAQKVLHRDIKPANLLLDLQGMIWVTDFGLAKEEGDDLTQTGDLVGTLRYMAPERFSGVSDGRSDVYSLGLTLYELLTLRPAFAESDRGRLVKRIAHEEPPTPRKLDAHVPRDLETIILTAIAKEPRLRYQNAEAMCEDLRRFLADRPIRARRSAVWEHAWRWCRRNPLVAFLLMVVALLLSVVAGVATVAAFRLDRALDETRGAEQRARLRESEALVGRAHGIRLSQKPGQRFAALEALKQAAAIGHELHQPASWFDRLRNEAIAALALPDMHVTHEFAGFPPGTSSVDVDEDSQLYVRATEKGRCTVHCVADDSQVVELLPEQGEPVEATFGTGGRVAVRAKSSGRFWLWHLAADKPSLGFTADKVSGHDFRSDGRQLALLHHDQTLAVYDVASGQRMYRVSVGSWERNPSLRLHPHEPFAAIFSYYSNLLKVFDLRTGRHVEVQLPFRRSGVADWSPDGRMLTVPHGDSGLLQQCAFDALGPSLRPLRTIHGPEMGGANLAYNPAGDRFVSSGWDGQVHLFNALSGVCLFSTRVFPSSPMTRLHFDRTGERLAAARLGDRQDRVGLLSVADGREYATLVAARASQGAPDGLARPAVHPNGRLAAIGLPHGLFFFDLETGRELARASGLKGAPSIAFDRCGNLFSTNLEGCFRWPVQAEGGSGRFVLGPPERLPLHPGDAPLATSDDGGVIAQCMWNGYGMSGYSGGWILHATSPVPRRVRAGQSMGGCSVSPDGHWVAFGGPHVPLQVYDAATAEVVWQAAEPGHEHCRFSPDGRWLVTGLDGGQLLAVGSWEPGPQLGPGTPWDVTAELAILGLHNGVYRLVELATGRELARLEDPAQCHGQAAFTPDGAKVVVAAKDGLRVWDLRRIRRELDRLGLNWHGRPFTPEPPKLPPLEIIPAPADRDLPTLQVAGESAMPVRESPAAAVFAYSVAIALMPVNPEAYLRRGRAYFQLGRCTEAADDLGVALALNPDQSDARIWFELGFACAYSRGPKPPNASYARHKQGIAAYTRALELNSKYALVWNNRGLYHEDIGELDKALADFSRSVEVNPREAYHWRNCMRIHRRLGQWTKVVEDCCGLLALVNEDDRPAIHDRLAEAYQALDRHAESLAEYRKAVELFPQNPEHQRALAWTLANCADVNLRDPARAVELAAMAVWTLPAAPRNWTTLGAAHFRTGNWALAREALTRSTELGRGGEAVDWLFLGMVHQRLGRHDEARTWFNRAVTWLEKHQPQLDSARARELQRFRAEAATVLGLAKP